MNDALVEYLPNSERAKKRESINSERVLPGFLIGFAFIAGRIWKGDVLIADKELEKLDASEIYPRRLNAKEVLISKKNEKLMFLVADGTAQLSGREYEFQEPTLRWEFTVRRENLSGESNCDKEEFRPEETKDDEAIHKDFRSMLNRDFNYVCRKKNHSQFR